MVHVRLDPGSTLYRLTCGHLPHVAMTPTETAVSKKCTVLPYVSISVQYIHPFRALDCRQHTFFPQGNVKSRVFAFCSPVDIIVVDVTCTPVQCNSEIVTQPALVYMAATGILYDCLRIRGKYKECCTGRRTPKSSCQVKMISNEGACDDSFTQVMVHRYHM